MTVVRVVRGFCVGSIIGNVWVNHGWEWFVCTSALWLTHLYIEHEDRRSEVRQ